MNEIDYNKNNTGENSDMDKNIAGASSENTNTNVNANANSANFSSGMSSANMAGNGDRQFGNYSGQNNSGYYNQSAYGGAYPNSYAPRYENPKQSSGQISYVPYPSGKKSKSKNGVSAKAVALICCFTVLASGCFGFAGAYVASYLSRRNSVLNQSDNTTNDGNVNIYRGVDEIPVTTTTNGEALSTAEVAAMVKDSVVEIVTENSVQSGWYQYVTKGAGSGVIVSSDGYILTNSHVVCNEDTQKLADNITVRLTNGDEYAAEVKGYDADADIAVLKIDADGLTPAVCGNSENLAVGEEVVVVGNPLGKLGGTVTNGIVSATEREIQISGVTMTLIQTNAAVNPGNSGGGMFNMKGELVGVVNAKSSGSGIEGLGFAIPVNDAVDIMKQLLEYGYVRGKPMIGVTFAEVSNSSFMFYYDLKEGIYVSDLTKGYNDDVLKVGDRVIAVNGTEVSSYNDIKSIVSASDVGDVLTFQIYRDGKLMEVDVTCYEKIPDGAPGVDFGDNSKEETAKPVPNDNIFYAKEFEAGKGPDTNQTFDADSFFGNKKETAMP